MAFLDNSGDLILDAVLTDTGRFRMAKGDGSFKIAKFAFADDEIDYSNYDLNHTSGSAFYDLEILQTPVLEAFTNNSSLMKSRLISIPRTNLLYLPILQLNEQPQATRRDTTLNVFWVAVNESTEDKVGTPQGLLRGVNPGERHVRVDQGLDTTEIPPAFELDADLVETQYIVEIDNRFGMIATSRGAHNSAVPAFIDDDNIASYFFSLGADPEYVLRNNDRDNPGTDQTIAGPRGTILEFTIKTSLDLSTSDNLFDKLGGTSSISHAGYGEETTTNVKHLDTIVRVSGATTGYSLDIPIRFIKRTSGS